MILVNYVGLGRERVSFVIRKMFAKFHSIPSAISLNRGLVRL